MGTAIVRLGNGTELLLTGSIPDLELDALSVDVYVFCLEINTNCGHKCLLELSICVPKEEARLSDCRLANDKNLKQLLVHDP